MISMHDHGDAWCMPSADVLEFVVDAADKSCIYLYIVVCEMCDKLPCPHDAIL